MELDYENVLVTEPYARDLILEAHDLLTPRYPSGMALVFVEFYGLPGLGLVSKDSVVFYNPDMVLELSFIKLCAVLKHVLHAHMMNVTEQPDVEDLVVPLGTTLH